LQTMLPSAGTSASCAMLKDQRAQSVTPSQRQEGLVGFHCHPPTKVADLMRPAHLD
jgi:hypothetical protein